jgi:hypothetical protein
MIDLQRAIDRHRRLTVLAIVSQTLLTATVFALVVILMVP